jgi:putative alpha-1,2-mannosidase
MRWTAPIIYLIVSPIHPKVTFHPSVKPFVMEAQNASPENFYVQSAELNRKPLTRAWLRYDEIGQGGHLKVLMGPEAATVTRVADLMVQDAAPRGRLQDDDCGTMSAWVILAQSGIYPMHPDAGIYVLCPPAFPEVRIDPGRGGRPLRIRGGGPPPRTIHAAHWQGAALDRPWLFAADLIHGGELTFTCGPPPSSWCRNPPPMPTPLNLTDQTASQRKESP